MFNHLRNFKKNVAGNKIELILRVPIVSLVGKYKMNGRVLLLTLNGHGKSNITSSKSYHCTDCTLKIIKK